MDYLKSNPEAAKTAHDQAQAMLRHPGVAQSVINSAPSRQVNTSIHISIPPFYVLVTLDSEHVPGNPWVFSPQTAWPLDDVLED